MVKSLKRRGKISFREAVTGLWGRISQLKLVITREVSDDRRVYTRSDLVLLCVSSALGIPLWRVTQVLDEHGDVACYSFMMNGLLQIISLLCFIELVAIQPCLGGVYHYTYNTSGRMVAFLVGWMLIGMMVMRIWEVPLNAHYVETYEGGHCPYLDQCVLHNHDATEVFEWLKEDFERYYSQNRAPYMMPFHTNWFQIKELENGLHKFIDWALGLEDVWFVTVTQMLTWATEPKTTKELNAFEPWKCSKKDNLPPPPCNLPNKCALSFRPPEANFTTTRYLATCRECPNKYPWLGDSEGTGIAGRDVYQRENR